ncbi:MAG: outer membrane beta-barrel protein [Alphaproteobacteria bacterium]|nr:outer membrane beta-barrel protein [Alphaproteobacteria bacterium]
MKKLTISALAVLLACPAFAGQHSDSSFTIMGLEPYIGLHGGMGYNNLNYSFNDKKESIQDLTFQGRVAMGLEVCDKVRSEIEYSFYSKAKDTKDFGDIKDVKVESKLQTLMWNSFWEFGNYDIIRPFIGAGIGLAFTDVSRNGATIDSYSQDKTRFTAMGSLGMTFDWKVFAVDVAARYNYVDVNSGLHDFGGDVGVRFMF